MVRHWPRRSRVVGLVLLGVWLSAGSFGNRRIAADPLAGLPGEVAIVPPSLDLGELRPGQSTRGRFAVHNAGSGPLVVRSVHSLCRCTLVETPVFRLEPGESRNITFEFSAVSRGRVERSTIFVETDDPLRPTAALPVIAQLEGPSVVPTVEVQPDRIEVDAEDLKVPFPLRLGNPAGIELPVAVRRGDRVLFEDTLRPLSSRTVPIDLGDLAEQGEFQLEVDAGGEQCHSITVREIPPEVREGKTRSVRARRGLAVAHGESLGSVTRIRLGSCGERTEIITQLVELSGKARKVAAIRQLTASRAFEVQASERALPAGGELPLRIVFQPGVRRGPQRSLWMLETDDGSQLRLWIDAYSPATANAAGVPLTLLASGNQRGALEPCECGGRSAGGLARLATLAHGQEELFLGVHCGNLIDPSSKAAEPMAEAGFFMLREAGFEVLVPGPRELALGAPALARLAETTGLAVVGTNVVDLATEQPVLPLFHRRRIGGVDIAVLGVVDLRCVADPRIPRAGLDLSREYEAVHRAVEELRGTVSMIVLAGTIDRQLGTDLAKLVPEIDVVLMGAESRTGCAESGDTLLCSIPAAGHSVLQVTGRVVGAGFQFDRGSTRALDQDLVRDPTALARLESYQKSLATLPLSPPSAVPHFVGSETCRSCHQEEWRTHRLSHHARAFETLQRAGREFDPDCLRCHTVGFDRGTGFRRFADSRPLAEVGCESCHGPGGDHVARLAPLGPARECTECHTAGESPGFHRAKYWAQLRHGGRTGPGKVDHGVSHFPPPFLPGAGDSPPEVEKSD